MINRFVVALAMIFVGVTSSFAASEPPRLVVNIVVGSMRAADLDRYAANFSENGIKMMRNGGVSFEQCHYPFQQTLTPVTLSTLATGAMPSTHGVVSAGWYDYTTNERQDLIEDPKYRNMKYDYSSPGYSADKLFAQTFTNATRMQVSGAKSLTIALDPVAAITLNGRGGDIYWLDKGSCQWATSIAFNSELPDWVERYNRTQIEMSRSTLGWSIKGDPQKYVNTRATDIAMRLTKSQRRESATLIDTTKPYNKVMYSPIGNTSTFEFAKIALANHDLGDDAVTDILNIHLSAASRIIEMYGTESIEAEDMFYRLDEQIADFVQFIVAQVHKGNVLFVLTSDHGSSPSYDLSEGMSDRFNSRQFEVIVNGFLNVRYGKGEWVLGCEDMNLYLNHNLIYENDLMLEQVQNEVADFAMQFGGVSYAMTATAMSSSYFGSGYGEKMQNSYFPRRSGDVVLSLLPGWFEMNDNCRSGSGSMYRYDTHVPLIFYRPNVNSVGQKIDREVDMTSVAPTLSRIIGINEPFASQGSVLGEVIKY